MVSSTNSQSFDDVLEHDIEETLTLDQLVESYQGNNPHNGCPEIENTNINQINDNGSNSNTNIVSQILDPNEDMQLHFLTEADDIEGNSRNTDTLRQYLEKECYCSTEWCNELLFPASLDRKFFKKLILYSMLEILSTKIKRIMVIIEYILILLNIQHMKRLKKNLKLIVI